MGSLLASAAILPWLHAGQAAAETKITTATTTPVATSTLANGAPDDLTIDTGGSVAPTTAGPAVTLDSDNKVANRGAVTLHNLNDSTGVLIRGGHTGGLDTTGAIALTEDYAPVDADGDGDLDGPVASGSGRYGVRVVGPGAFTGTISNGAGGSIAVNGNDSAGISVETRLNGDLVNNGGVSVVGDRSTAVLASDVGGNVRIAGSVSAQGEGATGVWLGNVDGGVVVQGGVSATGYRFVDRLADATARAKLDADDLKQGGPALRISGNVAHGVLLDRPPADLDPNVADEDGDGIADADEGTAAVMSSGSAPAIDLGGLGDTTIGAVGTGESAFGLVNKGQIAASGVNDGVSATGVRIGLPGGGRTRLEGGINNLGGSITAQAWEADATAIRLNPGADVPELHNSGVITATSNTGGANTAAAVVVEAGASLSVLRNSGQIIGSAVGPTGNGAAVIDRSGALSLIENNAVIQGGVSGATTGQTPLGRSIALDLGANTTGVTIRQTAGVEAPRIQGEVLLGSGDDKVELLSGAMSGLIDFGNGADELIIDGGATVSAALSDSDGRLDIDLNNGSLAVLQPWALKLNNLHVGALGALTVEVDPAAGTSTRLEASGEARIDTGATISVALKSLLTAPQSYEILHAGHLVAGDLTGSLVGSPYLYNAQLRPDAAAGSLFVDLRRRTAAEIGFRGGEGAAYDAVFSALSHDSKIQAAFLAQTTREGFLGLYDQMTPDHSGASLMSAAAIASSVSFAIDQRAERAGEDGGGFWVHEIYFNLDQDRVKAQGYRSKGFGLAGGLERTSAAGGAYGLALSLVSAEQHDQGAAANEQVVMNFAEASAYLVKAFGPVRANLRVGGGIVGFDSNRVFASAADNLSLEADANWLGWLGEAHFGLDADLSAGVFYARPQLSLDYLRLWEQGYEEKGGGAGLDLSVDSRSGDRLSGLAALSLGLRFGDEVRWGPEVTVGWRERLAGDAGTTTARFMSGGPDFTLDPENPFDGGALLRVGLKGTGRGVSITLDGGAEMNDSYEQWDVRAAAKFIF